ncbi:hypothetical protein DVA81_18865, partial [Acinetobacter baumannii]
YFFFLDNLLGQFLPSLNNNSEEAETGEREGCDTQQRSPSGTSDSSDQVAMWHVTDWIRRRSSLLTFKA